MRSRRQLLAGSAGLIAAGLAGCTGSGGSSEPSSGAGSGGENETTTTTTEEPESDTSYTVEMRPHGEFAFDAVPETYGVLDSAYLDMGVALGVQPAAAVGLERAPLKYYESLDGATLDTDEVTALGGDGGYEKSAFVDADADVWLADPRHLSETTDWSDADIEEVESETGPFVGSSIEFGPEANAEPESVYTLYEAFEKVAAVFGREQQFRTWQSLNLNVTGSINDALPGEDQRPTVAAIGPDVDPESGEFHVQPLGELQNNTKSYRRVGMQDAFAGNYPDGPVGYDDLLEVDPDYIGVVGALTTSTHEEFVSDVVEPFENHERGGELSAVQNGNVIRSGGQFMGPIVDLYSTEAVAKMVYPETFGEWPGAVGEVPEGERLFERQLVSDVITQNF